VKNTKNKKFNSFAKDYLERLNSSFDDQIFLQIEKLANDLKKIWMSKKNLFICGNGGSAANAIHMANDFHYGIGACGPAPLLPGIKVEALSSNSAIITCLGNDIGFEDIYSHQIEVKANASDLLIVLSGSGNSANVINALKKAKSIGVKTYAIVAFSGGKCKKVAHESIHFQINDMQIAEDAQLVVGHVCMQWLTINKPNSIN
tara:strand:- start:619 stop:1227 length:609 start_codon:yes stop_codon:yes gene_type:complete